VHKQVFFSDFVVSVHSSCIAFNQSTKCPHLSQSRDHKHASICCKHWREVTEHTNVGEKCDLSVTSWYQIVRSIVRA